jgi:hypothetical protein
MEDDFTISFFSSFKHTYLTACKSFTLLSVFSSCQNQWNFSFLMEQETWQMNSNEVKNNCRWNFSAIIHHCFVFCAFRKAHISIAGMKNKNLLQFIEKIFFNALCVFFFLNKIKCYIFFPSHNQPDTKLQQIEWHFWVNSLCTICSSFIICGIKTHVMCPLLWKLTIP